jgi:hypothetical protein
MWQGCHNYGLLLVVKTNSYGTWNSDSYKFEPGVSAGALSNSPAHYSGPKFLQEVQAILYVNYGTDGAWPREKTRRNYVCFLALPRGAKILEKS